MSAPLKWPIGASLSVAAAALYLSTLSLHYSSDSCVYAVEIASGAWRSAPHHLLLHPLGWVWFRSWQALGWTGDAMLPLQTLNALAGAACVGLLFWHCVRVTGSGIDAALAAGGFAVGGGLWLLSTEAEFVTVPFALELLVLGWVLCSADGAPARSAKPIALGAAIGVAMLTYASTAALLPVAVLALCTGPADAVQRRRSAALLLVGVALPVAVGLSVAVSALGPDGVVRAVLRPGLGYGVPGWQSLPRGAYAFLRTLIMFPGLGMSDRTWLWQQQATTVARMVFGLTYLAAAVAVAMPLAVVIGRWRDAGARPLMLWAALHVGFALYWVPSDVSFWLPAAAAWWLVVALCTAARRGARPLVAIAALVLLLVNGLGLMIPHHRGPAAGAAHPCESIRAPAPAPVTTR